MPITSTFILESAEDLAVVLRVILRWELNQTNGMFKREECDEWNKKTWIWKTNKISFTVNIPNRYGMVF